MLQSLCYREKVDFFFGSDPIENPPGNIHSTLRLIRNDVVTLSEGGLNHLAFPRAMCLMVAIDLIGKMQAGSDGKNIGKRFRKFVETALPPATYGRDIGTTIWGFRNALHHSYRMNTTKPDGQGGSISWRYLLIDQSAITWLTDDRPEYPGCTLINLYRLHEEIERGIERFHQSLVGTTDQTKRDRFEKMFDRHGWMPVGTLNLASP